MMETAGIMLPFFGTALGAALVFFLTRGMGPKLAGALNGMAAGIMVSASFFSLLLPSLEQAGIAAAAAGFLPGMLFLWAADGCTRRFGLSGRGFSLSRTEKMVLAVTVHNLPEGMAVGVAFAGWLQGGDGAALAGAMALSLGIALQNVPEGAIVSLPLAAEGAGKGKAFLWGVLSGAVEPVGAMLILLAAGWFAPVLPFLLSFAAGAMFSVTVEELIPEMERDAPRAPGSLWFALGFVVMMTLDVALG